MTAPPLRLTRQVTHPVVSSRKSGDFDHHRAPFQHTTENRLSLQGAPPVDRPVRPQRMSWTASWRSQRPPRFWTDTMDATIEDDDNVAYAVADSVLGTALPPIFPSIPFALPTSNERHTLEDDSTSDYSGLHGTGSEWSDAEDDAMIDSYQPVSFGEDDSPTMAYDSPLDGASPLDHSGSSPGPMTPFGEYVDRAIAVPIEDDHTASHAGYQVQSCDPNCHQCQRLAAPQVAEKAAIPSVITTPTATEAYRKLADHLSEWVSDYIWKMCTVAPFSQASPSSRPPSQLAASVRSVLLSTILQPSAVCLALKYISRLPVFLGPVILPADRRAEGDFRDALLGHPEAYGRLEMENQAPFRLVVLGFMFANKWLDDHTFSNKTWHTITGLPLRWINTLESLALRVFNYDLSITPSDWTHWLAHLQSYHSSLPAAAAQYPQPISRPGSSPHATIRRMLDDLLDTQEVKICPDSCCLLRRYPQPVFTGFQERIQQRKSELELEEMDINLDEDGPLREEYLPKRRSSTSSLNRLSYGSRTSKDTRRSSLIICTTGTDNTLPPPAKWSPDDDEPVHRPEDYVNRRSAAARPFHDLASMPASATQGAPPMQQWPIHQPYTAVSRIGFPPGNTMYAPPPAVAYMPTYNNYAASVRSPLGPSWADGNYLRAFPQSAYNSTSVWCRA